MYASKDVVLEFPMRICFQGEKGVDVGGLYRDMLSAFWDEAYCQLFDGGSLLSPAQVDVTLYYLGNNTVSWEP